MGLLGSSNGLKSVVLPKPSEKEVIAALGNDADGATPSAVAFTDLVKRFRAYFSGHKSDFPVELNYGGATPFQRGVWQAARQIPYGETRSYGWIARQMGKPGAARAVGQALGKNPFPVIVPCHRVVAGDGTLGGFTGGLEMKKLLLKLEKAAI